MTQYRVERNDSKTTTPIGMNSLLYLGNSATMADRFFRLNEPGLDAWNRRDDRYGITLSEWRGQRLTGEYVVIKHKGFEDAT